MGRDIDFSFDTDTFTVKASLTVQAHVSCVHCCALPTGVLHRHTIVAVTYAKTLERAWFNPNSIRSVKKYAGELVPNDGALGDWRYDARESLDGLVIETMTLTTEGRQLIWKLTDTHDNSMAASWLTGFSEMRLGVWAD